MLLLVDDLDSLAAMRLIRSAGRLVSVDGCVNVSAFYGGYDIAAHRLWRGLLNRLRCNRFGGGLIN